MSSSNGHAPEKAILYARVSTEEQAKSGYSLAQQMEALREYANEQEYEILEEVMDPGQSGASLARPGIDRVRDLVAAGGVSVVLAQDRDRFAREPAYLYLLREEFAEHSTKIRSLNDRGDESPEGELADGVLDQFAKYQRAKIAESTRRGKLRKVREGKVIAGRMAKYGIARYGFKFNEARDGLEVDDERMAVVRRVFYMIGVEGRPISGVKRALDAEGVATATGKKTWATTPIRDFVKDDIYKPHTYEEVKELVSPDVAARLDPEKHYGLWRWGRRQFKRTQVSEPGPNGRAYRQQQRWTFRPEEEWYYVPVPDSGIPREWVDAAREAIKENRKASNAGRRFWELSGGIVRCGWCGHSMYAHTTPDKGRRFFYYACKTKYKKGSDACPKALHIPAVKLEERIWEAMSGILKDPEQLRTDLDLMIEIERGSIRADPHKEVKLWANKLAEVDCKRARYQEMAAVDLITFDELRARLAELDEIRKTAERELDAVRHRKEYIKELERDRDTLLEKLETVAPEALRILTSEERHHVYKMLRLKVVANLDGSFEVSGAFGESLNFENLELCTPDASR